MPRFPTCKVSRHVKYNPYNTIESKQVPKSTVKFTLPKGNVEEKNKKTTQHQKGEKNLKLIRFKKTKRTKKKTKEKKQKKQHGSYIWDVFCTNGLLS